MEVTTLIISAILTLLCTIVAGIVIEYYKKSSPKIEYNIQDAIPISMEGKKIGANIITVRNPSSKQVRDLVIKIHSLARLVKNGGINSSDGLCYTVAEDNDILCINIPFLKSGERISVTSITEDKYYVPSKPEVSIRSPDEYKLIDTNAVQERGFFKWLGSSTITSVTAALIATLTFTVSSLTELPYTTNAKREQSQNLILVAAKLGLPEIARNYISTTGIYYYNQGPYIYLLAKTTDDMGQRKKLRDFLINTLRISDVSKVSRSCVSYFIGKISLLLNENTEADSWFQESKAINRDEYDFLENQFK